jgi:hypothetical protein
MQGDNLPIILKDIRSTSCEGIIALIQNPKSFAIVVGDSTGFITSATLIGDAMNISYRMSKASYSIRGMGTGLRWQSDGQSKISLQFNDNGTAKGKDKGGNGVYIRIGEQSTDEEVIADLKNKNLLSMAMGLIKRNKLPGHDAPTWYYYKTSDRIQISF